MIFKIKKEIKEDLREVELENDGGDVYIRLYDGKKRTEHDSIIGNFIEGNKLVIYEKSLTAFGVKLKIKKDS